MAAIITPYSRRSAYFEKIANNNKLIAHNRTDEDTGETRQSFFRMNDEEELNAACSNWAHFPCVVHLNHAYYYRENGTGTPRRINVNELMFLVPLNTDSIETGADQIEDAYNRAMNAMSKFISYMVEDAEANSSCGNLFIFTLSQSKVEKIGPVNGTLYGWLFSFNDEEKANELSYKTDDWFEGVDNGINHDCDCGQTEPPANDTGLSEYILFNNEDEVTINWDATRVSKFGEAPCIQVWFQDDDDVNLLRLVSVPIYADARPPDITQYRVVLTGDATGFITIN